MLNPGGIQLTTVLVRLAGENSSADHVAGALEQLWRDIDRALSPILGPRGAAALLARSVLDTAVQYPWIGQFERDQVARPILASLGTTISEQDGPVALAASLSLLRNFQDLLSSLLGASLTARLLDSVGAPTSSRAAAKDPQP